MRLKKVLVACEYSGRVRDAFLKKGADAYSCDLIATESNIKNRHIIGDVINLLNQDWDLLIAHPPCTYLSNAAACRLYPQKGILDVERYKKGLQAKEFFLTLLNSDIKHICIENPISSKIFGLPKHTQQIQPYEFGHPVSKKTRLWLKNLPHLQPTNIVDKEGTYIHSGTSRYKNTDKNKNRNFARGKDRSRTFTGIAEAMAEQWLKYIKQEIEPPKKQE